MGRAGHAHPVLTEFQELIDTDPVVRMYINQMIAQVPGTKPYRKRHLESPAQLVRLINEVLTLAPKFGGSMVATPLGAILDWTMATPAGFAASATRGSTRCSRRSSTPGVSSSAPAIRSTCSTIRRPAGNAQRPGARSALAQYPDTGDPWRLAACRTTAGEAEVEMERIHDGVRRPAKRHPAAADAGQVDPEHAEVAGIESVG
jgi:Phophatidylserine decarboxylase